MNKGLENPKCGNRHAVPHKGEKTIVCSPPLRGQYVVIQNFSSVALIIIEVEVFATNVEVE